MHFEPNQVSLLPRAASDGFVERSTRGGRSLTGGDGGHVQCGVYAGSSVLPFKELSPGSSAASTDGDTTVADGVL